MSIELPEGSRIAVVGGGPAGSFFAYFLLTFAQRCDLDLAVDVYEPRDFTKPGPGGCNMCGGIVSESLVQLLAAEGVNLPATVVQRGIDSYVLHTSQESIRIDTPLQEKRIAAVHRGGGPRDVRELKWGSFDDHLLRLAQDAGAKVIRARVSDLAWNDGRPEVHTQGGAQTYDLLVGATGVNATGLALFAKLGVPTRRCDTAKAYITELALGHETIARHFGNSMHMFLLDLPRLDCAALIPKGDYLTLCLLGSEVDKELIGAFLGHPAVRRCFPGTWEPGEGACHCSPKINVREAVRPFADRVVLIGDCGATRLYKDGIGAAYRTAKAAAKTVIFSGVGTDDFEKYYAPAYRRIANDNRFGWVMFAFVHRMKHIERALRGVVRMCGREQRVPGAARRMSIVLWDMFTGSSPYRDIFVRTLDPRFFLRFAWETALASSNGVAENVEVAQHG